MKDIIDLLLILYFLSSFATIFLSVKLYYRLREELDVIRAWIVFNHQLFSSVMKDIAQDESLKDNEKIKNFMFVCDYISFLTEKGILNASEISQNTPSG